MASDPLFAQYVTDQVRGAGQVSHRKMFGEYAVYLDGKVVGLICDDQFFVRPTAAGRSLLGTPTEAPPYPGAKLHFLASDHLDDRSFLTALVQATARELPLPKPKPRKEPAPKK